MKTSAKIREKTYKFARPKLTNINGKPFELEYSWMLVLESIEDLIDYTETYQKATIEEGIKELFYKNYAFHNTSRWAGAVESLATIREENFLVTSTRLENDVFRAKARMILDYGRIYVNASGGFFPHMPNSHEIIEEVDMKGMEWPTADLTEKDIHITRWPNGGTHYYAKVGVMDVEVDGKVKWDTWKEARAASEKWLRELKGNVKDDIS